MKEKEKNCIICGELKKLSAFYKHKQMADGHLNKCKDCTKSQSKEREEKLRQDPEWVEKERIRHREKYDRLNYKEKQKEWDLNSPWKKTSKYKNLSRKFKLPEGYERHHWNYNDEFLEDFFSLKRGNHKKIHTKLVLDFERRIFMTLNGEYLDTREKHENYINQFI